MTDTDVTPLRERAERQASLVQGLRAAVYGRQDPSADEKLLEELARAEAALRAMQKQLAGAPPPAPAAPATPPPPTNRPRLLGPETTELRVESRLRMQPLPTGIYHLLDPEKDPLFTVTVENLAAQDRRVRVTAFLEGLSARAVKTVELKRK